MDPVDFPESTIKLAKRQPQFRVLPVFISQPDEDGVKQYTCKYQFTDLEKQQIASHGYIYISQFGTGFHPIRPQAYSPFEYYIVEFNEVEPGYYDLWVKMDDGGVIEFKRIDKLLVLYKLCQRIKNIRPETIMFLERKTSGVDENGNIIPI